MPKEIFRALRMKCLSIVVGVIGTGIKIYNYRYPDITSKTASLLANGESSHGCYNKYDDRADSVSDLGSVADNNNYDVSFADAWNVGTANPGFLP